MSEQFVKCVKKITGSKPTNQKWKKRQWYKGRTICNEHSYTSNSLLYRNSESCLFCNRAVYFIDIDRYTDGLVFSTPDISNYYASFYLSATGPRKWEHEIQLMNLNWPCYFSTLKLICKETKLRELYYKFLHRIIATKKELYCFGIESNKDCLY